MQNKVFDKFWFERHQSKLLWLSNSWLGKYVLGIGRNGHSVDPKNKIAKITPCSVAEFLGYKGEEIELREHFFGTNYYAKRLYFYLLPLWYTMHVWDWFVADHFRLAPQLSFGFSTLTVNPGSIGANNPADGNVRRDSVNQTWSNIRAGAGTAASNTYLDAGFDCSSTSNQFSRLRRGLVFFDTSSLTSGATISGAVLSLYCAGKSFDAGLVTKPIFHIASGNAANTNALVSGDYAQANFGTTSFASVTYDNYSTVAYTDFTLNASGISNVSKTGISKFSHQTDSDITGSNTATWSSWAATVAQPFTMANGSSSQYPKLVVTYTVVVAPTVTTQAVSSIGITTATGNGNVTADGGATVTARGVCWNTSANPTLANSNASGGSGTGAFTASITGLLPNTLYYVSTYATNSAGTSYGSDVTFTTLSVGNMFLVF